MKRNIMKRRNRPVWIAVLLAALCVLTGAAAERDPNALLEDNLKITDSIRELFREDGLIDTQKIRVENAGIAVTLDECVADARHIRAAFRVSGVMIPDEEQPLFDGIRIVVPGLDNDGEAASAGFINWVEDRRIVWNDAGGDATFFFACYTDQEGFSFAGKEITVTLEKLVYSRYGGEDKVVADGKWEFSWELHCTEKERQLAGLELEVPETRAVLTDLAIAPMHMAASLVVPGYFDGEAPYITGVVMQDGTAVTGMMESTSMSPQDRKKATCSHVYFFNRVIDPDQVAALLFTNELWDRGTTVTVPLPAAR